MRYMDYGYWIELSGATRHPADAAARIRSGIEVFGFSSDGFRDAARVFAAAWTGRS